MTNRQTAILMGDPQVAHLAHADVVERRDHQMAEMAELRQRVKAELLAETKPRKREALPPIAPVDPDAQARAMWDQGVCLGDIVAFQKRTLAEIAMAIQGEKERS